MTPIPTDIFNNKSGAQRDAHMLATLTAAAGAAGMATACTADHYSAPRP